MKGPYTDGFSYLRLQERLSH